MLFSELYKIMVNKAIFLGFRRGDRSLPWIHPCAKVGVTSSCYTRAKLETKNRRSSAPGIAAFYLHSNAPSTATAAKQC